MHTILREQENFQHAIVFVEQDVVRYTQTRLQPLQPHDVRIQVEMLGICGAESRAIRGGKKGVNATSVRPGIILGHEGVGTIVEIGNQVRNYGIGDRVAILSHVPCGICRECVARHTNRCLTLEHVGLTRDGSAAEYVSLPALFPTIVRIPKTIPAKIATLIEPLSCVSHGMKKLLGYLGSNLNTTTIGIIGGGPIGMLWALQSLLEGFQRVVIIDTHKNPETLYGAIPEHYRERVIVTNTWTDIEPKSIDVYILANSDPDAYKHAEKSLRENGAIVSFSGLNGFSSKKLEDGTYGMNLSEEEWSQCNPRLLSQVHYSEIVHTTKLNTTHITLIGSSGYTIADAESCIAWLSTQDSKIEMFAGMITHELDLADGARVYQHFGKQTELSTGYYDAKESIKIVIRPQKGITDITSQSQYLQ